MVGPAVGPPDAHAELLALGLRHRAQPPAVQLVQGHPEPGAELEDLDEREARELDRLRDHGAELAVGGELARVEPAVAAAQHLLHVEGRQPVALERGGRGEPLGRQRGVLAARHAVEHVVVQQHRQVHVHERGLREVEQPDRRAAVAEHDDVLQTALGAERVGEDGAGGDGRGPAVDRVDGVQRGEQRVHEPHAADVGREHDPARVEAEAPERLVEAARHEAVAAAAAVGHRALGEEAHRASRISAGRIIPPSLLTEESSTPGKAPASTRR